MIDSNELGGFIGHCRQPEYLRQIIAACTDQLDKIGVPTAICRTCSGRKVVVKNIGEKMTEVPCPTCSPAKVVDPEIVLGFEDRLNAMQEAMLKKNARIEELERKLAKQGEVLFEGMPADANAVCANETVTLTTAGTTISHYTTDGPEIPADEPEIMAPAVSG